MKKINSSLFYKHLAELLDSGIPLGKSLETISEYEHIGEIRESRFPVFARGVVSVPGKKDFISPLNQPIRCGGAHVSGGDIIIADEDGVVVVPADKAAEYYKIAKACEEKEQSTSLDDWEIAHRKKIAKLLELKNADWKHCRLIYNF